MPFSLTSSPTNLCGNLDFWGCFGRFFFVTFETIVILAIGLSVISVTWSGFLYIVKGTNKEDIDKVYKRLIWSIVGLVIALFSYGIVLLLKNNLYKMVFNFWLSDFVNAAQISPSSPPSELKCDESGTSLPSIFSSRSVSSEIWKSCLLFYLTKIMSLFYRLALYLAIIFISWAGILYIIYPEKSKEIHSRLIWGIVGAVVALLSFTIVKLIESFFLNVISP
ncbi:MAG: hypothetical protein KatS3mg093_356 [Candidatus Parcubacteria bacterium]|nr:MAG: hypothetical protein KatS3mg093_356 [Candidatus Parcubacteria bacterium]